MAMSYDLEIATPQSVECVAQTLHAVMKKYWPTDAAREWGDALTDGFVSRSGLWIRVFAEDPPPWNPVVTDLGIAYTASISFSINMNLDVTTQQDDMVGITADLLPEITGDLVLEYSSEEIWLLRRGSDVDVSENEQLWPPRRLSRLSFDYRRHTHIFPGEHQE